MTKTFNDPEHVTGVLSDKVHYLNEALWEYLHDPTDRHLFEINQAVDEVRTDASDIFEFVRAGHESMKGDIVDGS